MPPHRSASLRAALTPPCPGATARMTSPSAGCPALAAGRRTRRANAPHRSRSCWRRLNRCSQPRPPSFDGRASGTVVARCTNVLTNAPSARSRVHSILPCGACSLGFRAPTARGSGCAFRAGPTPGSRRFARDPEPGQTGKTDTSASVPSPARSRCRAALRHQCPNPPPGRWRRNRGPAASRRSFGRCPPFETAPAWRSC